MKQGKGSGPNKAERGRRINGRAKVKKKTKASVKSQLRSLQRLLRKDDLSPKIRRALEAKVEALTTAHESHKQSEKERQLAVRYHRIKFFERVKIERKIASLSKEVVGKDLSAEAQESARASLAKSQQDLQYVLHFPKGEKYVSLLKEAATPETQAALEQERERLRALVRQRIADQKMLAEVNEGAEDLALHEEPAPGKERKIVESPEMRMRAGAGSPGKKGIFPQDQPLPAQKRQKTEGLAKSRNRTLLTQAAPTWLASGDDFFLEEERQQTPSEQVQSEKPHVSKPSVSKEEGHLGRDTPHEPNHGVQLMETIVLDSAKAKGKKAKQHFEQPGKVKQRLAVEVPETSGRRTRAEGGRKRRKKPKP